MSGDATWAVLGEIGQERQRQVEVHGSTPEHDDSHDRRAWAWLLEGRVHALACPFDEAVLDERRQLVEVAAIAVAAIEAHDRRESHLSSPLPGRYEHDRPRTRAPADVRIGDQLRSPKLG